MKLYYNILFLVLLLTSCQHSDELQEFIRLEKDIASTTIIQDRDNHKNKYENTAAKDRITRYTEPVINISSAYDSLIIDKTEPSYKDAYLIVNLINKNRISNLSLNSWESERIDNLMQINSTYDSQFNKYNMRCRLSEIFSLINPFKGDNGYTYPTMELHPFIVYEKLGSHVQGEFGIGFVFYRENSIHPFKAEITLKKNNKLIEAYALEKYVTKTSASFTAKDTGVHELTAYFEVIDPVTGKPDRYEHKRNIYVKARR